MFDLDRTIEIAAKLLNIIRPKFYNKLSWSVVITGLTLMGTPFWEKILNIILEHEFQIKITGGNDVAWGFGLVVVGLIYHISTTSIFEATTNRKKTEFENAEKNHDISLFKKLIDLLPSNSFMIFIRDHDFANSFDRKLIDPAYQFIYEWDNAEQEFINQNIEQAKKFLYEKGGRFTHYVGKNTSPNHHGWQSAIPKNIDPDMGFPEHVKKEIKELNDSASEFYQAHQTFIRVSKANLGNY